MILLVFVWPAWAQVIEHKLTASDGVTYDQFGYSVSLSGDRVLVGAISDDDLGYFSGSAYVYEQQGDGSWLEVDKLHASDGSENDGFGRSASLSGDRALIGAPRWGVGGIGSAYAYERQEDGSWLEVDKLNASDGEAGDAFGWTVSLSGPRALVGAFLDDNVSTDSGSAYVFERQEDGSWLEVAKLTASDGKADDHFGGGVSLWGDRALVGAAVDDDLGSNSGSAYVFEQQNNESWLEVIKLTASDGAALDWFGGSVSLSGDRAIVGAHGDDTLRGSAYVFENIFPVANELPADLYESYLLSEPYPNPSNRQIRFSLAIAETQHVRIDVVSTLGQRVSVVQEGLLTGNRTHELTFDAGSLPSGVYLLRVTGEDFVATRTMTLLK